MEDVKGTSHGSSFVQYLRVSTHKQGLNGNGIGAQERDIEIFLGGQRNPRTIGKFVEVDSGGNDERPQLRRALSLCRSSNAQLLVSKVDRLSRDVEFIAKLVKDKSVTIRVANLPNADNFQIHLFAALGQAEREFISQRTKAAMAAAKLKGRKFGNPKISELNKSKVKKARTYSNTISHIVLPLRNRGMSYQQIADTLNSMELKTRQGCSFHPIQVKRVLDRVK